MPLSTLPLGVGGMPRAQLHFSGQASEYIRHSSFLSCRHGPGPYVPDEWFDAGNGWCTKYVYDARTEEEDGAQLLRCQVRLADGTLCNHRIEKGGWWCCGATVASIREHVADAHPDAVVREVPRPWTTSLFLQEGWMEAFWCAPCQGSRQLMALAGWPDAFHLGWCVVLSGLSVNVQSGTVMAVPPCICAALASRLDVVVMNRLDESKCNSIAISLCLPVCSLAQTRRELNAAGVPPGSALPRLYCNDDEEPTLKSRAAAMS